MSASGRPIPSLDGLRAVSTAAVVVGHGAARARAPEHPALVWLGRLSCSVYLWQQLFLVRPRAPDGSARALPLALLGTAGAAALSYAVVERPALARQARYTRTPVRRWG